MTRSDDFKIVAADASSFDLRLGDKIMLQPEGLDYRMHSIFLGMERNKYLITSLETNGTTPADIYAALGKNNPARLFYTSDGVLKGFLTNVIGHTTAPYKHIYLTFPHSAEHFIMRRDLRHQCHIPTRLCLNGECYEGMALNISESGCAVAVDAPEGAGQEMEDATYVEFGCNLIGMGVESTAICRVKNTRRAKDKLIVGMAFEAISEINKGRVLSFLEFLTRFTPAD